MEMANTDCVTDFGKGKFRYINSEYQDVKIKSRKRKQIKLDFLASLLNKSLTELIQTLEKIKNGIKPNNSYAKSAL